MIPSIEEIERIACIPQKDESGNTNRDWRRARLGCFTSSEISDLMIMSKEEKDYLKLLNEGKVSLKKTELQEMMKLTGKSEYDVLEEAYKNALAEAQRKYEENPFGLTTMSYLYKVASERNLCNAFVNDDAMFDYFMQRTDVSNRDMRWGTEMEPYARQQYQKESGLEVAEVGFVRSNEIDWLGDSPDGLPVDSETGRPIGALEIKCPKSATWLLYRYEFEKGKRNGLTPEEVLKEIKPEYYWQCQCHCAVNKVEWCDFVFYDQMQKGQMYIYRIHANKQDIALMYDRVERANRFIDKFILI